MLKKELKTNSDHLNVAVDDASILAAPPFTSITAIIVIRQLQPTPAHLENLGLQQWTETSLFPIFSTFGYTCGLL